MFELAFGDGLGGDTADHSPLLHVLGDHGTGGYNCALADGDAGEDDGPGTDENVILDDNGGINGGKVRMVDVMLAVEDHDLTGNIDVVADGERGAAV